MKDKIQIAVAALLVVTGVVLFSKLSDQPTIARLGAMFGCFLIAGVAAWFTEVGREFVQYTKESIEEAKKVVWPTRKETMQSTGVIFVFVVVMAVFLWVVDWTLTLGITKIIGGA